MRPGEVRGGEALDVRENEGWGVCEVRGGEVEEMRESRGKEGKWAKQCGESKG